MAFEVHTTRDYHLRGIETLGWELTVCNALRTVGSPLRKILSRDASYGEFLSDYLNRRLPMKDVANIVEIGGGYGVLMKDLLSRNDFRRVTMIDISPFLLGKQRETLEGSIAEYREEDFLDTPPSVLEGADLAILNENLGDFPVITDIDPQDLHECREEDGPLNEALKLVRKYGLKHPEKERFNLNIGALKAVEKLCSAQIPYIFLSEHSCEAVVPGPYRSVIRVSSPGNPERIRLRGHDEYTIRFSHLEAVAKASSYNPARGPLADFIPLRFNDRVKSILAARWTEKDEHEIIRHFVEDLYQYEYLLLIREGAGSPKCRRCGKCCLADFIAYVTEEDIGRWRREGREDILGMIKKEHAVWAGDHFVSSEDGHYLKGCPFLTWEGSRSSCAIYETRPGVCRRFAPASSEICPQYIFTLTGSLTL